MLCGLYLLSHTLKQCKGPWSFSIKKCPCLLFYPLYQKVCIGSRSWWSKWKLGQRSIGALSARPETLCTNNLTLGQFDVSYWPRFFPGPPQNSPCIPTHQNLKHGVWHSAVKLYLQANKSSLHPEKWNIDLEYLNTLIGLQCSYILC